MKYSILLLPMIVILFGCGSTKEMKQQNAELISKSAAMQNKLQKAEAENKELAQFNSKKTAELAECTGDLARVSKVYDAYTDKLKKMKAELDAAFPNKLNDENFAILEENGRLIVRLPNRILYSSGSAEFNGDALTVIQKISQVFKNNKGLNILIEGHTDDTPIRAGSRYEDNWDLSLARAVKITRKLELYGVHPARLTAAGRGYFSPINNEDTNEARMQNRRTELIIVPRMTDLLQTMESLN